MLEDVRTRNEQLRVWLSKEEKELLVENSRAVNLSISDYIRRLINGERIIQLASFDTGQMKDFIYELNKIGNNLNQITRMINIKKDITDDDWEMVMSSYSDLVGLMGDMIVSRKDED